MTQVKKNIYITCLLFATFQTISCSQINNNDLAFNQYDWDSEVLMEALNSEYVQWTNNPNVNTEYTTFGVIYSGKALNYLSLVAFYDRTGQYPEVSAKVIDHLKYLISGGKEPCCRGVIAGWADNSLAQSIVLAKNTKAVWSKFSDIEKGKLDLLMKALAIAGNYCQNSQNDVRKGLYQTFDWKKTWNPNHQEGYVGIMISAWAYFGGKEQVNKILQDFNYEKYMIDFQQSGFENVRSCWQATGKILMENGGTDSGGGTTKGVKIPFTYSSLNGFGEIGYDPYLLYKELATRMFINKVTSTECNGSAFIIDGTKSPYEGQAGMCYEFRTQDASGCRSSAGYCFDGWMNNMLTLASLQALGFLQEGEELDNLIAKMKVGSEDLIYKLQHGYHARKNAKFMIEYENDMTGLGYRFIKDIYKMIRKNL